MGYSDLKECVRDLERAGMLLRVNAPVGADQELAAIQRRACRAKGPALLFTRVEGTPFPMLANLFGTMERARFLFRDTLRRVEAFMEAKADPMAALKRPLRSLSLIPGLATVPPKKVKTGPVMEHETSIASLPMLRSWPLDGGGYVTLPQVYTEDPAKPGFPSSNLGMYRVQLSGGKFRHNEEVGLHYQIHRGIGPHHARAISRGEPLRVNVFVGGPPAMTLAAVMPLPEGVPEIFFAGLLGGRRVEMVAAGNSPNRLPILAQADFCLSGTIDPGKTLPEGPFGDHLGYYSLAHDFPVMRVDKVLHRTGAIWPFTTVGRPPQEDTVFGQFVHELTGALVPTVFSGVREVHAVDAAGVHPLLLAVGSERYVPYAENRVPQELLTCGMALLGSTQTSLSKYVLLAAHEDAPGLSASDVPAFLAHVLARADWTRDLHFLTRTTMDTLDYSGISLNQGSKLVLAACGPPRNELGEELPRDFTLPDGFADPLVFAPGILLVSGPKHMVGRNESDPAVEAFCDALEPKRSLSRFPLVVVVDDAEFTGRDWDNFLWVAFTRSDPATDLYGVRSFTHCKHWGCEGSLVMDSRLKSHHAPPLEEDSEAVKKAESLAAPGGPLHGVY